MYVHLAGADAGSRAAVPTVAPGGPVVGPGRHPSGPRRQGRRVSEMTENQRRAQDVLTVQDLMVRGASAIGLIVAALVALLAIQTA